MLVLGLIRVKNSFGLGIDLGEVMIRVRVRV